MENSQKEESVPFPQGPVTRQDFNELKKALIRQQREIERLQNQIQKLKGWQNLIMGGIAVGAYLLGYVIKK